MSTSASAGKGGANPSVYDKSAAAFGGAGDLLKQAQARFADAKPGSAEGYRPATIHSVGYDAAKTGGVSYDPAMMRASSMATPEAIASGMKAYMNPYEQDVINRSMLDINRFTAQQDAATGASASSAGAFGGSRHGIVEALTRSEAQKNIGDLSANLRMKGFDTAAGLSAQDIANRMASGQFNATLAQQAAGANQAATNQGLEFGAGSNMTANLANQAATNAARATGANNSMTARLANQGSRNTAYQFGAAANNQRDLDRANFDIARGQGLAGLSMGAQGLGESLFGAGQQITSNQMGAGGLQQQLMQQILGNTQGQYDEFMGRPGNLLSMQLQALGMNPLTNTGKTSQTYKPGLMDFLGLGIQGLGAWRQGA